MLISFGNVGSDANLAKRMYQSLTESVRFTATKVQQTNNLFCINHYAGPVIYSTTGFVEKNKDEVPSEVAELSGASSVNLLKLIFSEGFYAVASTGSDSTTGGKSAAPARRTSLDKKASQSVCSQFKDQLTSLMEKIEMAKPHYVRCIKPNDVHKPDVFNAVRTTEQLRCGGVLEAVRVARSGFPYRMSHTDFYSRYRSLVNPFNPAAAKLPLGCGADGRKSCMALIQLLWDDSTLPAVATNPVEKLKNGRKLEYMRKWKGKATSDGIGKESIQIGKTKIFLRKPPHDLLEGRRSRLTFFAAVKIQAAIMGFTTRKWFRKVRKACVKIQRNMKGILLRKRIAVRIEVRRLKREEELIRKREAEKKAALEKQAAAAAMQKDLLKASLAEMAKKRAAKTTPIAAEETKQVEALEKEVEKIEAEQKKAEDELVHQQKQAETIQTRLEKLKSLDNNSKNKKASVSRLIKSVVLGPKYRSKHKDAENAVEESGDNEIATDDADMPASNTDISRLYNKSANVAEKEAYKKQFPKLYSKSRILNMFSSTRRNIEEEDAETASASAGKSASAPRATLKEKIFGKKADPAKPKMAKRMKYADEQYNLELKMYLAIAKK